MDISWELNRLINFPAINNNSLFSPLCSFHDSFDEFIVKMKLREWEKERERERKGENTLLTRV